MAQSAGLVATELVSGNYFDVLAFSRALGRLLLASDDTQPNANPVAVLSFNYWRRRFDADPMVLNQTILVNGIPSPCWRGPTRLSQRCDGRHSRLFVPMMMRSSHAGK